MILTVTLNPSVDKLYVIDRLRPYEVSRVSEVVNTAGGKGLNVSRVAALAGQAVTAMGLIGGHQGAFLESLIAVPRITTAFTHVACETRSCVNVRDLERNKSTEFLEPGQPITPAELDRFLADFRRLVPTAAVVAISGSLPAGVPADFYATLTRIAAGMGKPVILDSSGESLRQALAAKPTWIKPNADEIRQITAASVDSRAALISAAAALQASGIAHVAVSLGKEGVLVVCAQGIYHGQTPNIPVVNTVGCGDSMVAGFAVGTANDWSITETIRYAVAVSTANALTKETGSFRQVDLERLLPQIEVHPVV